MKLQKLVVMTALAGVLGTTHANALGLGEVKLYSSLNQPLVAEIELLQVGDLTKNEILPNLASRSDFQRAGVERPLSLSGLTFRTVLGEDGTRVIKVTSSQPVQEPYLNFLLEVHWPSGRLLREYTLLLDPPAFNSQPVAPVQPPQMPSRKVYSVRDEVPAGREHSPGHPDSSALSVRKLSPPQEQGGYSSAPSISAEGYTVRPGDTLWEVAQGIRPGDDLSIQQTMLAVQRSNPDAFDKNNINRLRRGAVLRIPKRSEISEITAREAIVAVARQNKAWRNDMQMAQIDGTRRDKPESSGSTATEKGKLAIVGSETQVGQGQDLGGDKSANNGALQTELAMTRERLDKLTRENAELVSRLTDLDEQVATLNRLLTLKDDQMAALQAEMNQVPPTPVQQPEPPAIQQPVEPEEELEAEQESESGFFNGLLSNPIVWVLLLLLPAGGAGFWYYRRRKEQEEWDEDDGEAVTLDFGNDDESPDAETDSDDSVATNPPPLEEDIEAAQETGDVLSEADIYIAYGQFDQALQLLGKAITEEPERTDLRLKQLEVHGENNNLEGFKEALVGLEALGDVDAMGQADALKARFPEGSFGDLPPATDDLDDLGLDLNEEAGSNPEVSEDTSLEDLEFDLGDFDLDDDADEEESPAAETSGDDDEGLDFDLDDLDLDLDDVDEAGSESGAEEGGDELNLDDLDLELDLDEGGSEESESEAPVADESDELELDDLELSLDDEESAEQIEPDQDEASLSLDPDAEAAFSDEGGSHLESALNDDDLDFLSEGDEAATKLDLAKAYMDMGDEDGAKDILQEVIEQGTDEQKAEAQGLIQQMG